MIALEQARQHLETLGLKQAVEVLDNTLDAAANKQLPYPEMLAELLGVEVAARRGNAISPLKTQDGASSLPAHPGTIRLRLPALHRRNGWSRYCLTRPSSPRPPMCCCWDRPAWARPIWPSHWR